MQASKNGRARGIFQGASQLSRQNRLSDESNRLVWKDCIPRCFVEISTQEYAAQSMTGMQLAGGINPAASQRKPDVYEGHIGTMRGRVYDGVSLTRGNGANLVAKLRHQHFEMHGYERLVFDDQDPHASLLCRQWDNHLHGITVGTLPCFNASAKLLNKGLYNPRAHSRLRLVWWRTLSGIGYTERQRSLRAKPHHHAPWRTRVLDRHW